MVVTSVPLALRGREFETQPLAVEALKKTSAWAGTGGMLHTKCFPDSRAKPRLV